VRRLCGVQAHGYQVGNGSYWDLGDTEDRTLQPVRIEDPLPGVHRGTWLGPVAHALRERLAERLPLRGESPVLDVS
jgi:hypothetical protein